MQSLRMCRGKCGYDVTLVQISKWSGNKTYRHLNLVLFHWKVLIHAEIKDLLPVAQSDCKTSSRWTKLDFVTFSLDEVSRCSFQGRVELD